MWVCFIVYLLYNCICCEYFILSIPVVMCSSIRELNVTITHDLNNSTTVFSYNELNALISGLNHDVRFLHLYEIDDPSVSKVSTLPSLAHLPNVYAITLTRFTNLTTLPDLFTGYMIGSHLVTLKVSSCPCVDLSQLPQGLLELHVTNHPFIETITIPSITRKVSFTNCQIGRFFPPSDWLQYEPLRGVLDLTATTFWSYPKIMKLLGYPSVDPNFLPNPRMSLEKCSEEYLNPNMDDIDLYGIQPDSLYEWDSINPLYWMYETYRIFVKENQRIDAALFSLLSSATRHHLHVLLNSEGCISDPNNLQENLPIHCAMTRASNPLRESLAYVNT